MQNPFQPYQADSARYKAMQYRRSGKSGLKLPAISLGLWHNFGDVDPLVNARSMLHRAFDLGFSGLPSDYEANGLGLHVARTNIEKYGGTLMLDSGGEGEGRAT